MSYTPNNAAIYLAAYAGALAGLGACTQPISNVTNPANMADAFAQAVDTVWGATGFAVLDQTELQECSEAAWENRSPLKMPDAQIASAYTGIATEIVALVRAGTARVRAEGIDPNAGGGGGGGVTWAADLAGSNNASQWVAAISGNGGLGGAVPLNGGAYIRGASGAAILAYRNAANSADVTALSSDGSDNVILNGSNQAILGAGGHNYWFVQNTLVHLGVFFGELSPTADLGSTLGDVLHRPSALFSQQGVSGGTSTTGAGVQFLITSEAAQGGSGGKGGDLSLNLGAGDGAGGFGKVNFQANGTTLASFDGANGFLEWAKATVNPAIVQLAQTTDTPTNVLTVQAQAAFSGATGTNRQGGTLSLDSGASRAAQPSVLQIGRNNATEILFQKAMTMQTSPGNSNFGLGGSSSDGENFSWQRANPLDVSAAGSFHIASGSPPFFELIGTPGSDVLITFDDVPGFYMMRFGLTMGGHNVVLQVGGVTKLTITPAEVTTLGVIDSPTIFIWLLGGGGLQAR